MSYEHEKALLRAAERMGQWIEEAGRVNPEQSVPASVWIEVRNAAAEVVAHAAELIDEAEDSGQAH